MRAHEFLVEGSQWELIDSSNDKERWGNDLIQLVQNAYKNTNLGSFVNSLHDVKRSDWLVLDWDDCNQPDSAIFYRKSLPNENWIGFKIQGIGYDNHLKSKQSAIEKVKQQLLKDGWWIESSHAMAKTLGKIGAPPVKDEKLLRAIFPNSNLKMLDQTGMYERSLDGGRVIQEHIFGKPQIKMLNTR